MMTQVEEPLLKDDLFKNLMDDYFESLNSLVENCIAVNGFMGSRDFIMHLYILVAGKAKNFEYLVTNMERL
jgi:hypothetical protein